MTIFVDIFCRREANYEKNASDENGENETRHIRKATRFSGKKNRK